jgi:hypothetical protein
MEPNARRVRREIVEETRETSVNVVQERLSVRRRQIAPHPASADEIARAFQTETVCIPVFGEVPRTSKQIVVTGEVTAPRPLGSPAPTAPPTPASELIEATSKLAADSSAQPESGEEIPPAAPKEVAIRASESSDTRPTETSAPRWRQVIEEVQQGWARARST